LLDDDWWSLKEMGLILPRIRELRAFFTIRVVTEVYLGSPRGMAEGDSHEETLRNIERCLEDIKAAGDPIPIEDGRKHVEVTSAV
jgi:hypothetical protein